MARFQIVIGNKNYSSWSMRAWLALRHVTEEFEEILIPLDEPTTSEEIFRYSPSGKVPALIDHAPVGGGTDEEPVTVWDSLAIAEYLAEAFPAAGLWPDDPKQRAHARAVAAEMHSGFPEVRRNLPMNIRASAPGRSIETPIQAEINRVTAIWRDCRGRYGDAGPFLFGRFTIADAMFAPMIVRFRTFGISLGEAASAYANTVWSHETVVEWAAAARNEPMVIPRLEP